MVRRHLGFVFFLLVLSLTGPATAAEPQVVILARSNGAARYTINNLPVQEPELLRAFGEMLEGSSNGVAVSVYIEQSVPIKDVQNLQGVIHKAGIAAVRFFVFSIPSEKMVELEFKGLALVVPPSVLKMGDETNK